MHQWIKKSCIVLFWVLVWQSLALWVDNKILLVTPAQVLARLAELVPDGKFWITILHSFARIGLGFGLGTATAFILAALGSKYSFAEEMLEPLMTLLKTIPVASFVVLLLIWWGASSLAIAISFLIVLPNIYISTLEGIRSADPKMLEMAKVFELPATSVFFYIYRPALSPFLISSFRLALGMCWKSGVAAEVIGTPDYTIGEQLYLSKINLDTAGVFAWTIVIILLSLCFEKAMMYILNCFFAWEPPCRGSLRRKPATRNGIVVSGLHKQYGEQQLFREYTKQYHPGETYYLTEPSGRGKTTLLRLLCGLEKPDAGKVIFEGKFSMVFQEDRLCESYSALRNIEMVVGSRSAARKALLTLLDEEALDKPASQLSGGMKRRVALVRAMEAASDCVLLDEPFTGMDPLTRARAEEYIQKKQEGRILVIATHNVGKGEKYNG